MAGQKTHRLGIKAAVYVTPVILTLYCEASQGARSARVQCGAASRVAPDDRAVETRRSNLTGSPI